MTIESRLPYLAALLIENSISEQEVQELLALPLTQFLPFTDEKQVNAILTAIQPRASRWTYYPKTFSVSKVASTIIVIKCERSDDYGDYKESMTQYPIWDRGSTSSPYLISSHIAPGEESALLIEAVGLPTPSGKTALYKVSGIHCDIEGVTEYVTELDIPMQTQAPMLRTPNGITIETLLAIAAHQLEGLQAGPYPCEENATALQHVSYALEKLKQRTTARIQQGVKNTQGIHKPLSEIDMLYAETLSRSIYLVIKDDGAEYRRLVSLYKDIIYRLLSPVLGDEVLEVYLIESLANALDTCQIPRKGPTLDAAFQRVLDPNVLPSERARKIVETVVDEHSRNRAIRGFTISD